MSWTSKQNSQRRAQLRLMVFKLLGNECVLCGFNNPHALQIDHINGGGRKEFKKYKHSAGLYYKIIESIEKDMGEYQLLCANCNWIKRYNNPSERGGYLTE